jgi:hypothetical protein
LGTLYSPVTGGGEGGGETLNFGSTGKTKSATQSRFLVTGSMSFMQAFGFFYAHILYLILNVLVSMLIAAHDKGRILLITLATINYQFLGALPHIEKKSLLASSCPSVCINSAPTRRICIKYDIGGLSENV